MTDFLQHYHLLGLAVGFVVFLCIGIFHPLVIKAEYYWGQRSIWAFAVGGIVFTACSLGTTDFFASVVFGGLAASSFWSIGEIKKQKKRVEKGWFPNNPNRKHP